MISDKINIQADWNRWIIKEEVSDEGLANIRFKKKGLIDLPQTGWQYADDDGWHDDNTLSVKGNNISCRQQRGINILIIILQKESLPILTL